MAAKITMARIDSSRHMQEQPALFLLFKIASLFCTLCSHKNILKYFIC